MGVPVIVKVLGALAAILIVNRFVGNLVISIGIGALALGLWSGHSASGMLAVAWHGLSSTSNLLLLLVVLQVIWLSSQMSETGVMDELVAAVRALVSQRAAMAALPAVIGLLPMPGGALFSAPLVDSCDVERGIAPALKAQTNHWFRHVWEYWWPLYPGVLLAMKLTKLEVWQFMMMGIPLSVCAIVAGYVFLLRRIKSDGGDAPSKRPAESWTRSLRTLASLLLPIALVIGCYALVRLLYAGVRHVRPQTPEMNSFVPMIVGLCVAMAVLQWQRPVGGARWAGILLSGRAWSMVAIVVMVLVYGAFVEAKLPSGERLVERMQAEMAQWGIPLTAIIVLLPLVSGLSMGLSAGFVGASFPIVMSLVGEQPALRELLSTTVLAYGFGYMGMLLSPVHVCLIVTSEHFHIGVLRNVAGMLKPAAVMLVITVLVHMALR